MTINLHDITGQESGVILVDTGAGRQNVVANWGDRDGLPYFMPYYAATNDPFPFLFMDVADIHVDRPLVHKGRLRDEVAHDGFDDWNPLNDDLESDEPCTVYPLSNGWTVTPTTTDTSSAVKSKTTIRPCRNWKPTNSTRTPWNPTQGGGEPCLTLNNCYPTCAIWNTN